MTRGKHITPIVKISKIVKFSLCDYSDAYILVSGTITTTGIGDDAAARQADERNKGVILKNCTMVYNVPLFLSSACLAAASSPVPVVVIVPLASIYASL